MLNENEKIVSWIDELFSERYPCLWAEDNDQNCNICAKLGEITCDNDMNGQCFEPIQ